MKKCILFLAMLLALCFVLTGCDSGSSGGGDDPVPPPAPSTYTVSFDMEGHGTQIDPITGVESGAKITKPADPTATGFNFVRWCKDVDRITAWDFDSDTVTEDITLYALWTEKPVYTISFNANGGSGSMTSVRVIGGEMYVVPASTFVTPKIPTGAVNEGADILFKKWNTKADGTGITYAEGDPIQVTDNITLTAQWAKPVFSVSAGRKVYFAKGNLQAVFESAGSTKTWKFADHQYDYIGDAVANTKINGNGSVSKAGTVDLFGWSTDKTDYGINPADYRVSGAYDGNFKDWGNIAISNGGNASNAWRTLTGRSDGEVKYLFSGRTNASNLYKTNVTVCGINGCLIIAPDNFTGTISDSYDASSWATAEAAGLVCLPLTGVRMGTDIEMTDEIVGGMEEFKIGQYWLSTVGNAIGFDDGYNWNFDMGCNVSWSRFVGMAVRLVRDAE